MNKVKTKKSKINGKNIYFVGIGGVSMSALAKLCAHHGCKVCGVDAQHSQATQMLIDMGIPVYFSPNPKVVEKCDFLVYTVAASAHPDILYATKMKKKIFERAEFLGLVAREYQHVIAISGTHGKTTTTALIGHIFDIAGLKPTVHVGGFAPDIGGNLLLGNSNFFITEACEYNKSFLHLRPDCAVVTNVECDHMDTYKNYDDILATFTQFCKNTTSALIMHESVNIDGKRSVLKITYGATNKAKLCAKNLKNVGGKYSFDCFYRNRFLFRIKLQLIGRHNVDNALAGIAVALHYRVPLKDIIKGVESFSGVDRRFTSIGSKDGVQHYIDYAHHPTEIKALLDSISNLGVRGKVVMIFQPHTYSRTKSLLNDFASALSECPDLILLPTYAARECPIEGGDSTDLFFALPPRHNHLYCSNYFNLKYNLDKMLKPNDLCVWVGAGDIADIAKYYIKDKSVL